MPQSVTFPWSWYDDADILRLEREHLFRPSWQYVGHVGMLEPPTTHFPAEAGGVPVVVTRGPDDELSALANICAHRGSVVCSAPGTSDRLRCAYHAWTYGLDGSLVRAPRSDREATFEASEHRLRRMAVETWGPFIFVNATGGEPSLEAALGDVPERIAESIVVDRLVFRHRAEASYRANWKICVENFLECYHCRVAHPSFSQVVDTSPDDYVLEAGTAGSSQYGPVRDTWSGRFDPVGPIERGQFHLVHPNTAINVFPGQVNLSIGPVLPTGPDTTVRFLDYFFAEGTDEGWIQTLLELDHAVGAEDLALVESVQRGVSAAPGRRGHLFLDSEVLIAHFQEYVRGALPAEAATDRGPGVHL
jgi:phenylpropionate dioxygenase-like ring-hydroxylating dioxygenase large terminal subunit